MSAVLAYGLRDPVFDAQRAFRGIMNALARPGSAQRLGVALDPPDALPAGLGIVALTLADHAAALWLDDTLRSSSEAADYLRFHTGAPIVDDPSLAAFALVADPRACPPFEAFALGTLEYPDRSTTIVFAADNLRGGTPLAVEGPGLAHRGTFAVEPLPPDFVCRWRANGARFPCGVDLIFATEDEVVGLPRTTRIREES